MPMARSRGVNPCPFFFVWVGPDRGESLNRARTAKARGPVEGSESVLVFCPNVRPGCRQRLDGADLPVPGGLVQRGGVAVGFRLQLCPGRQQGPDGVNVPVPRGLSAGG